MVYLREILKQNKAKLVQYKNIELAAYLFLQSFDEIPNHTFELTQEEEVALKGFKKEYIDVANITSILSKIPIKGISATSNIFKLAGLYLSAKNELALNLSEKYQHSDIKQKYFLSKIEPSFKDRLFAEIVSMDNDSLSILIKAIYDRSLVNEAELNSAIQSIIIENDIDVPLQILLEDFEKSILTITLLNKSATEIIRDVFSNFSNAIQKIIKNRRKDHFEYKIDDEYDVQDILYVILKSFFPNLMDEDTISKVGGKSTKIDLIVREENILIEVKMIKDKDKNENNFIDELKIDFESYHECIWLKKLFCIVYDPHKKTRDINNFTNLNGDRVKNNHSYNVEVIVVN